MDTAKKPKLEAGHEFEIFFTLSQPKTCSVFDIVDGVVDFQCHKFLGQNLPAKKVFVRGCYKEFRRRIWDLLEQTSGVAVLGTPGIGKSLFGILFLIETIQCLRKKTTMKLYDKPLAWPVVYATEECHFIFQDGKVSCVDGKVSVSVAPGFLILDGKATYNSVFNCPCVWLSSPRLDTLKQTIKREGFQRLYMPPWTPDELVQCWKKECASERLFNGAKGPHWELAIPLLQELGTVPDHEWQEEVLRLWIHEVGPVPRRVFMPREGLLTIRSALTDETDYSSLLKAYDQDEPTMTEKFLHSHTLLLMMPTLACTSFVFAPATVNIARHVLQLMLAKDLKQAQSLMGRMEGAQLGHVFQPYMEHILSLGGHFEVRSLEEHRTISEFDVAPCATKLLSKEEFDELKVSAPNTLYVPQEPDFPAVDCWTQNLMFQATVSSDHPIASAATRFLKLKPLVHFPKLVFVVPKNLAETFKKQHFIAAGSKKISPAGVSGGWNDIEQYVLGL